MLGHRLWQTLSLQHETFGTVRGRADADARHRAVDRSQIVEGVRADDLRSVEGALDAVRPEVVVNCIGLVKQLDAAFRPEDSILVNGLFPQQLATRCQERGVRLIHLSTDCVFSGKRGGYREVDEPDPVDLYGRSKLVGEVVRDGCLTLRTSMIGREQGSAHGLVEWFLAQRGKTVQGYQRAVFSGLTTDALATVIAATIERHPDLSGLWHVAAEPIDKYTLLGLVNAAYGADVTIEPSSTFFCDRSLDGSRFREATGLVAPSWPTMIAQMASLDGR